ncbi:MAG: LamG domain-containing protein [Paludibacter sp.]
MKKKNYFSRLKEIGSACLLFAALSYSTFSFADITTGLKLYYNFETVSGITVPDVTGNGLDGMLMGGPVVLPGKSGSGLNFPTVSNPAVDYVLMPNGITADLTDFTVATWVKMDKVDWWMRLFDLGSGTSNYIMCTAMGGNLKVEFKYNGGGGQLVDTSSPLPSGHWVHVALTCAYVDGVGTAKLYLNGAVVGTNTGITITPSMLDALVPSNQNYIAKSQWPDNGMNGTVDEFRIYRRALSGDDILELNGTPPELVKQWKALTIAGDLTAVTKNVVLPTTLGTGGVTAVWSSSNKAVIDSLGNVVRPAKFDAVVILTATVSITVDGVISTLKKTFTATVTAPVAVPDEVAKWNFESANIAVTDGVTTVKDEFTSGFVGTLMNDARIRTIGTDKKYNVLDLGNGTGYFDMGTSIGEQVYSLNDKFTIGGYFRMDSNYTGNGSWGTNIFSFSNTENDLSDPKGTMYACLGHTNYAISAGSWSSGGEAGVNPNKTPSTGTWHHYAYVQNGTVGSIYFDGTLVSTGSVSAYPSSTLVRPGQIGTLFNWIGRPPYGSPDAYLQKTLVYGFSMYRVSLTGDDINNTLAVPTVIADLNNAYAQDSDYKSPALANEVTALTLPNLSAVTANITLPSVGTLNPAVTITWKCNQPALVSTTGVVTRPDYSDFKVTLTATLVYNGATVKKSFPATIKVKAGTAYTNTLLVKYDFAPANVSNDSIVTDAAEKHFTGIVKKDAKIVTIGTSKKFNVLSLGDNVGYFDMGTEMGKVANHLTDYTIGAYYRVDASYTNINANGNMLWSIANSKDVVNEANGYLISTLKNQCVLVTSTHYAGEKGLSMAKNAPLDGWHHIAYTQKDTIGTLYIDGVFALSGTNKLFPSEALTKDGLLGTAYNWIGRPCYALDAYLRKTLVTDFRLYSKALTDAEIETSEMKVAATIAELNLAYTEASSVQSIFDSPYSVVSTTGKIQINGLTGLEKISLFDITGRRLVINIPTDITTKSGVYVVKIDNYIAKVVVR